MKKSSLVIFALAVACVAAFINMNFDGNGIDRRQTIRPIYGDLVITKKISGKLYPEMEVSVKSSVSGTLEEYYVEIGDKVRKGDKIAKIKVITNASQLEEAKAQVASYRALNERLKKTYERNQILYEKGLIAACDFETAKTEYLANQAKYKAAQNQLQIMMGSGKLSNLVTAPCDGVISSLPLEKGFSVMEISNYGEGTTVAHISQNSRFVFKSKVVEADVIELRRGKNIPVTITSSEREVMACIDKISTEGSYDEHGIMKYEIQAVFTPPQNLVIYSGFSAQAIITTKVKRNVLTIPCQYVEFRHDSAFVYVRVDNSIDKKYVKVGDSDGECYEIISGIDKSSDVFLPVETEK